MFQIVKGDINIPEGKKYIERKAIKGIVKSNDKYLVLKTNKGDYKLPGGGQKEEEDDYSTLKREFDEEAGYKLTEVNGLLGITKEIGPDKFDDQAYFAMVNLYYECNVDESCQGTQTLDSYEETLEITPVWVSLEEIIDHNQGILDHDENVNPWVERELGIFKELKLMCR